jgi:hypothetical protein
MTDRDGTSGSLAERVDTIESAYEFMLAYAAQGRQGSEGGAADEVRGYLERLDRALDGIGTACKAAAAGPGAARLEIDGFVGVLEQDAGKARAAVRLVLSKGGISSQLVDNLNASIHLRALLTDLFIIDEALSPRG